MGELARGLDDMVSSKKSPEELAAIEEKKAKIAAEKKAKKSKNKYKIGDIVQHKASGEKAVIINIHESECQNPEHQNNPFVCFKKDKNCIYVLLDLYDISISFDKQIDEIPGFLLKKIPDHICRL